MYYKYLFEINMHALNYVFIFILFCTCNIYLKSVYTCTIFNKTSKLVNIFTILEKLERFFYGMCYSDKKQMSTLLVYWNHDKGCRVQ